MNQDFEEKNEISIDCEVQTEEKKETVECVENKCYELEKTVENNSSPKEKKSKAGGIRKLLIAACCGLCFGLFAGGGFYVVNKIVGNF